MAFCEIEEEKNDYLLVNSTSRSRYRIAISFVPSRLLYFSCAWDRVILTSWTSPSSVELISCSPRRTKFKFERRQCAAVRTCLLEISEPPFLEEKTILKNIHFLETNFSKHTAFKRLFTQIVHISKQPDPRIGSCKEWFISFRHFYFSIIGNIGLTLLCRLSANNFCSLCFGEAASFIWHKQTSLNIHVRLLCRFCCSFRWFYWSISQWAANKWLYFTAICIWIFNILHIIWIFIFCKEFI